MPADRDAPQWPVSFAELDEATRQRAQIVVLHDRQELDRAGSRWFLSLTDVTATPIARERVHVVDDDTKALLALASQYLHAIGMRVAGDWFTNADLDRTRHYARVCACSSRN